MVLDPESLQLYRSGLLGTDPSNAPVFRVNEVYYLKYIYSMDLFRFLVLMIMFLRHFLNIIGHHYIEVIHPLKRNNEERRISFRYPS
jgi:hypothetical protein